MSENSLTNYVNKNERIYIYGAGNYGRIVKTYLTERDIRVDSFVVTKRDSVVNMVLDIPIYEVSSLTEEQKKGGFILAMSSKYQREVIEKLEKIGITNYYVLDNETIKKIDLENTYEVVPHMDSAKILLYHRVIDINNDIWKLAIAPAMFERQMRFLKENYDIVRYEDIDFEKAGKQVAITFDDGYVDNYQYVLPILSKLKIPAIVFVATGNINSQSEFWWDELERMIYCNPNCPSRLTVLGECYSLINAREKKEACYSIREKILEMNFEDRVVFFDELREITGDQGHQRLNNRTLSVEELKEMDKSPFITIGGHTVTHTRLTSQTKEQQYWEIEESKKKLEAILGHRIDCFSYPFGGSTDYDMDTICCAINAGYEKIAAVQKRYTEKEMARLDPNRIGVQDLKNDDELREFRRLLSIN